MIESPRSVVSFSLWETLITENARFDEEVQSARVEVIRRFLGMPHGPRTHGRIRDAYDRASDEEERAWISGETVDNKRRIRRLIDCLGVTLPPVGFNSLREALESSHASKGIRLTPHALPVLRELNRSYRVIVISDTWMTTGQYLRRALMDHGIGDYIDEFFFSDEMARGKFHPETFRHVLHSVGADPEQSSHVGDIQEIDIYGAQMAGYGQQILIDVKQHPVKFPHSARSLFPPTATIQSLEELPSCILR